MKEVAVDQNRALSIVIDLLDNTEARALALATISEIFEVAMETDSTEVQDLASEFLTMVKDAPFGVNIAGLLLALLGYYSLATAAVDNYEAGKITAMQKEAGYN